MKKGKVIVGTGLTATVAAVALFLSQHGCSGSGVGNNDYEGDNSGVSQSDDNSVIDQNKEVTEATTEASTNATQQEIVTVEITIDGRDYLYNNKKMTLDELMAEVEKSDKSAEISISCEASATVNAKDELIEQLNEKGFTKVSVK